MSAFEDMRGAGEFEAEEWPCDAENINLIFTEFVSLLWEVLDCE